MCCTHSCSRWKQRTSRKTSWPARRLWWPTSWSGTRTTDGDGAGHRRCNCLHRYLRHVQSHTAAVDGVVRRCTVRWPFPRWRHRRRRRHRHHHLRLRYRWPDSLRKSRLVSRAPPPGDTDRSHRRARKRHHRNCRYRTRHTRPSSNAAACSITPVMWKR